MEAVVGIEPTHRGFANHCVTTSPHGRFFWRPPFNEFSTKCSGMYQILVQKSMDSRKRPGSSRRGLAAKDAVSSARICRVL